MQAQSGKLILLGLPIGNVEDLSSRVKESLLNGQVFICEDTRKFKALLNYLNIPLTDKETLSFHDHSNEQLIENKIFSFFEQGKDVYYVSDAGSPVLSDPGHVLAKLAWQHNWEFDCYSSISAITAALEHSGFAAVPYYFHGFTSREESKRRSFFQLIIEQKAVHVWFEPPHRVKKALLELEQICPESQIFIGRELTKTYQSTHRFYLKDLSENLSSITFKGEFVLVLDQTHAHKETSMADLSKLAKEIEEKGPSKKAVAKLIAKILARPSKELYDKWTK